MRGLGGVLAGVLLTVGSLVAVGVAPAWAVHHEALGVTTASNPGCSSSSETQFTFVNTSGLDDTEVFLAPITQVASMRPAALNGQSTSLLNKDGTTDFYSADPSTHSYYFCLNQQAGGRLWVSLGQAIPTGSGGLPGTQPDQTAAYRWGLVEFGAAGATKSVDFSNVNDFDFALNLQSYSSPGGSPPIQTANFSGNGCQIVQAMRTAIQRADLNPESIVLTSNGKPDGQFIRVISPDDYNTAALWPVMTPYINAVAARGPIVVEGYYFPGQPDTQNYGWYYYTGTFSGGDLTLTGTVAGKTKPDPSGTAGSKITIPLSALADGIYNQGINATNYTVSPLPALPDNPMNDVYAKVYNDLTTAFGYGYWGSTYPGKTGLDTQGFWKDWAPPALPAQGQAAYPPKSADFGTAPYNLYAKVLDEFSPSYTMPFSENYGQGGKGMSPLLDEPLNGEVRMTLPPDGWSIPSNSSSQCNAFVSTPPSTQPQLGVTVGSDGRTAMVTGSAFLPATTLSVSIASTTTMLGTVTVSNTGTFTQAFSVPCSVPDGSHTVSATASSGQSASATVTLTSCPTTAVTVAPKFTG